MPYEDFSSFKEPSQKEQDAQDKLLVEKSNFEKEFKNFFLTLTAIPADHGLVLGKPREYISSADAYKVYKTSFKKEALAPTSILYRLRNIKEEDFPDDFIIDPTQQRYESKYFINRLNKELLKKIFLPTVKGESRAEVEYTQRQDAQAFREMDERPEDEEPGESHTDIL